jgi:hypothetical protein
MIRALSFRDREFRNDRTGLFTTIDPGSASRAASGITG